jgi:propionyl-CoA carboxylase beta chain
MSSKHIRSDLNLAFPGAEIAVMGPEAAVNIIYRQAIDSAADRDAAREAFVRDYRERIANPFKAAELGFIDAVIRPHELRTRFYDALEVLRTKRQSNPPRKHGNIPL